MLKYRVNVMEELKKAGYSSYRLRKEKVLGEATLQKIRVGSTTLTLESLGVICDILHCQPGDLVEWVEGGPAERRPAARDCDRRLPQSGS